MSGEDNMTILEKRLSTEQRSARFAFRFALIMFAATAMVTAVFYYNAFQINEPQMFMAANLLGLFLFFTIIAAFLSKHKRPQAGMWLIFLSMMIICTISSTLIIGLGVVMGLSLPLLISQIAGHVLPTKQMLRVTVASVIAGAATILIDIFGSAARLEVPFLQRFVPIIAILIVIMFGFIIVKQFPHYKVRTKLIIATAIVASLAVVAVAFFAINSTQGELEEQVSANLEKLTEVQALAVGELMTRQIDTLKALSFNKFIHDAIVARNASISFQGTTASETQEITDSFNKRWLAADDLDPLVINILNNSTSNELQTYREAFPRHVELILTDKHGRLIAATQRSEQFTFRNEEWWDITFASGFGQTYIGSPFYSAERDAILIDIAVPVKVTNVNGSRGVGGVLLSRFNMDSIADVLATARFGERGQMELHLPGNLKLLLSDSNQAAFNIEQAVQSTGFSLQEFQPEEIVMIDQLHNSGVSVIRTVYQGEQSTVSKASVNSLSQDRAIDRTGWLIVAYQPESEAFAPVQELIRTNILAGIIVVLAASAIAAGVGQYFAKPIVEMTDVAVKISEGDLSAQVLVNNKDELGTLGNSFNRMTKQLRDAISGLEERVNERTKALEASAEVSRSLSTIMDQDKLISEVSEQIRSAFNYYHAHIFLFDEDTESLVLSGGTGEVGAAMLAAGHVIPKGRGLVGQAALKNQVILIPDVSLAEEWLPNKLLPDTKAEVAVPIALGDELLGVLDVQDNKVGGLNQDTANLLQSIASQLAIALQNTQAFAAARQRAEHEAVINQIRQKIQDTTEIESAMQIAARELGIALNAKRTAVKLTIQPGENGHE
jgi:putative methionine-R-sulfoxide reductase with GAF domain